MPKYTRVMLQRGHKCCCFLIIWGEGEKRDFRGASEAGSKTEIKRTKKQMPHVPF